MNFIKDLIFIIFLTTLAACNKIGTSEFNDLINGTTVVAPVISYSGANGNTGLVGSAMIVSPTTLVSAGASVTSCSSSPSLPSGLSIDSVTCVVTGTPSSLLSATVYTIAATNSAGTSTAFLTLSVNANSPSLSYIGSTGAPNLVRALSTITPMIFSSNGAAISSCTISPPLSAGLAIDNSTCVISGTPTTTSMATVYSVTATNSIGSISANVTIGVDANSPSISFDAATGTNGAIGTSMSVSPTTFFENGASITNCATTPSLPAWATINSSTCVISGTPDANLSSTSFTVTATNSAGSTTANVSLSVGASAPSLSFSASTGMSGAYGVAMSVTPSTLSANGAAITNCATTPSLPSWATINSSTCVISGTPDAILSSTSFTVTATNGAGSTTANVSLSVGASAPSLSFSASSGTSGSYGVVMSVTPSTLSANGAAITNCATTPSLPSWATINSSTCVISGIPDAILSSTSFTVTATNSAGSTTANVSLSVGASAPSLSFSASAGTSGSYGVAMSVTPSTLSANGAAITNCAITPSLPSWATINSSTCVISGTPDAILSSTSFTVTATNSLGSTTANVSLSVGASAPSLSFSASTGMSGAYGVAMSVTPSTLSANGAAITNCATTPSLPSWATINSSTCVISGTPDAGLSSTSYTIIATNSAGSSAGADVSLSVGAGVPTISYSGAAGTNGRTGEAMNVAPTSLISNGANVTLCSSSPSLPAWASLNATTCEITGVPTGARAPTTYTITARNSAGNSLGATVTLSVSPLVEAIWPTNGANWMDYVSNDTTKKITQVTDTACTGSETGFFACLHGGEYRKVVIDSETSCSNLTITEHLGVFDWVCDDSSGTQVVFISVGLKKGKGLRDLIESDGSNWKENKVTITGGSSTYESISSRTWWSNGLTALPVNSTAGDAAVSLSSSGEIYYLADSSGVTNTNGYYLGVNKIAVVTLGSSSLVYGSNTSGASNSSTAGNKTSPSLRVMLFSDQDFQWFEAKLDTTGSPGSNHAENGIRLGGSVFSRVNNTIINGSPEPSSTALFLFTGTLQTKITGLSISNPSQSNISAFAIQGSQFSNYHFIQDYTLANNYGNSVATSTHTGDDIVFHRIKINNGSGTVFSNANGSKNNRYIEGIVSQWGNVVNSAFNDYGVYSGFSIFNSGSSNSNPFGAALNQNKLHNLVVANGAGRGLGVVSAVTDTTYSQLAILNMLQVSGIHLDKDSVALDNKFTGNLILGSNVAECAYEVSTRSLATIGMTVAGGATAGNCETDGISDANIVSGKTIAGAIVGKIATDDTANASSDVNGQALYALSNDWFNFTNNFFRGWGVTGNATFPDNSGADTNTGRCLSGNTCSIWDYSLRTKSAASSVIYNNSDSGSTTANSSVTGGGSCPDEIDGSTRILKTAPFTYDLDIATNGMSTGYNGYNVTDTDFTDLCSAGETCEQRYLKNAIELIGAINTDDSSSTFGQIVGDLDGLCEAGETCLYTPNFGAYQGHSNNSGEYNLNGTRNWAGTGPFKTCTYGTNTSAPYNIPNVKIYFYESNGY
jgi:hypothetical protein